MSISRMRSANSIASVSGCARRVAADGDENQSENQRARENDPVYRREAEIRDIHVARRVRRELLVGIDVPEQAIGDSEDGLISPGIASAGALGHAFLVVFQQHPLRPALQIRARLSQIRGRASGAR